MSEPLESTETRANRVPGCRLQQATWTNSTLSLMRVAHLFAIRRQIIRGDCVSAR